MSVLIFLIVLGVIIFVHELGHFIAAKRAGMRVDEFGFGFPPRIFGIKKGGTIYSLNLIPLGGFVKIKGENGEDAWENDSFASKSLPRRVSVILAGVTMNILLAFVLLTGGYLVGVPQAVDPSVKGNVTNVSVRVTQVLPGSPAAKAGFLPNDIVGSVDGQAVMAAEDLRSFIRSGSGEIKFTIKRDQAEKEVIVTPEILAETNARGIGVGLADIGTVRYPWYSAPLHGALATVSLLVSIAISFWQLIVGLVAGHGLNADIAGPVGIAVITGEATKLGFMYLLEFTALLSLNLAVINAIPFPALDGGRFLFLIVEALRGRAVSRKVEAIAHQLGFALLMLLVLAVTYRDLVRYSGAIGGFFKGLL